jgi:hypothetical protein
MKPIRVPDILFWSVNLSTRTRDAQLAVANTGRKSRCTFSMIGLLLIQALGVSQMKAEITYEAENGALLNGANVQGSDKASGSAMVGFLGGEKGGAVVFDPITVARGGAYLLAVRYASGDPRALNITVNGAQTVRMHGLASRGWFDFALTNVEIRLKTGKNTIRLDNNRGWAPNIDKITLTPISFWRTLGIWLWIGLFCSVGILTVVLVMVFRRKQAAGL